MIKPELLAPAGDWDCLRAAVANGADAVYFGLPRFNARLRANNFTESELPEVMGFLRKHGVKGYVTLNTLVFTRELASAAEYLKELERSGVDAVIVQDLGVAWLARKIAPGLAVHASTQMTITSPEGVAFAESLGVSRVILARELSLRDLKFFSGITLPLELFVHGALCVAYSGQCLTSESLGQRSANRGECAQACRMPYDLVVDGKIEPLGDRRYLLSPQDLAAVDQVPELIASGILSFKIEGRLKSAEYVAAVTQVYRRAIDAAWLKAFENASEAERYQLEMTFSRGLYPGWVNGVNHQELVSARFGKKRGALVGRISKVGRDFVECKMLVPVKAGDGVVFDTGGNPDQEAGGRVYEVRGNQLFFQHGRIDFRKVKHGDRIWKTDDPELNKRLKQSYSGRLVGRKRPISVVFRGSVGAFLQVEGRDAERSVTVVSTLPLQAAATCPLEEARLREVFGRLGETPFELGAVTVEWEGSVILPISELNRLRRELVSQLLEPKEPGRAGVTWESFLPERSPERSLGEPSIHLLCRTMEQLEVALEEAVPWVYVDFEEVTRYRAAVERVRSTGTKTQIALATPRIQKPSENGIFKLIAGTEPDAVLVRNPGGLAFFKEAGMRMLGDFSWNVANPLTAAVLRERGLERLTISYDLNIEQVIDLLQQTPPEWLELTIHQQMPMFHMEHCVFAAFLSKGTDHTNCGRPCDRHSVQLRDRVGMAHPVKADVGCRNTVYNAKAQTGAQFYPVLREAGLRHFRIEWLLQPADECHRILRLYRRLLSGETEGAALWEELRAQSKLGVTRGSYE